MNRVAALDIGDVWTGVALSDPLGITTRPYTTIKTIDLDSFLPTFITKERISSIVVGLPKTMKGTESKQTEKVKKQFEQLRASYPNIAWHLWDERLSSKRAATLKPQKSKEDKQRSHAIAAAFILSTYLSARV